jgi:maltose alpha-D-glucosyltransferase/alpha-amylase
VASMMRSFLQAATQGLCRHLDQGGVPSDTLPLLEPWALSWALWSSSAFLRAYLRTLEPSPLLPSRREDLGGLLFVYLLEKALEDLGDDLAQRPEALRLTLHSLARLAEA